MITGSLTTGYRLEFELTATDIRECIWKYLQKLEESVDQQVAREHRQILFQKESLPNPRYIRLSFLKDFPDIICLHESVGLFRGLSLEETLARESDAAPFVKKVWLDEHSINAIWQGFDLDEFATSWKNLLAVLNDLGSISFEYTLGLHPDTFSSISAELLPLFSHMDPSSSLSKQ
ncbi:MAG: hypothetical protein NPIRA01_39630 [Nitrospirales bacterium]|nr:MAG: hypothetical protein NPIRA01_39630 [Nitrospirales bacterium]